MTTSNHILINLDDFADTEEHDHEDVKLKRQEPRVR